MASAQHFQELILILQQDGQQRSVQVLHKMNEICNKYLEFFQKYKLNSLLREDQMMEFYRNLSLFRFKVSKKQNKKPKSLQAQGLLFLLEGELSRYIVNIRNENQEENSNKQNNETLYSLYTYTPGEEIGQIMDFFKKSQAFRIELSCIKDCVFMQINQGYFQQYLEQQLKQFNQSQLYFLRDISYFSHLTRDEIMLIYMTSKFQQNLKGDLVHNPSKSIFLGTVKIILEGEILARCQVSLKSISSLANSERTDLSSLQKIASKKHVYSSLFLQSPFDFFALENYNLNQNEMISQKNNYEIICHSQFAKILCIWPSIIQIINNNQFQKQMIQIKQNQMNLIKAKISKIQDLQNSNSKSKKKQNKTEQKSLSSIEVPSDILSYLPQKSQNSPTLKNQTSTPSQILLPAVFQDEIMLNALSSIQSIKEVSQNNQIQTKRYSHHNESNQNLKNSNTIDVLSAFKQNRKNSLSYEIDTKKLKQQKSNLLLRNKQQTDLNQQSLDYISYDQVNKQIESLFQEKQSNEQNGIRRNLKNSNENQSEEKYHSQSLNKRNSQSYRKNTHFFIQNLKKTIDNNRDNQIYQLRQNQLINDQNQLNSEDSYLYINKNVSFQQLLPHVDSIQNLTDLSNNKSKEEIKIKKKKNLYQQQENQNNLLPKLHDQKQQQNYNQTNIQSKKEISKLNLHNLDLSQLNEDSQQYNVKLEKVNNTIIHQNDQTLKAYRKKIEEDYSFTQRKKVVSCYENSQNLLQNQSQNKIQSRKIIKPNLEDSSLDKKLSVGKSSRKEYSLQENKTIKKEQQENKRFYLQIDSTLRQKMELNTIKNTLLKHTNNQSYTDLVSQKLESQKERSPQQNINQPVKKNILSKNLNKLIDQIHNQQNQKKVTVNQSQKYFDGLLNNSIVLTKQIDLNHTQI